MKVLLASGGSGGHIFPAVAVAKELQKENVEIVFVASRRKLDQDILKKYPFKKMFLTANPMPYNPGFRWIVFLLKLFVDALCTSWILFTTRPDRVVGFGGYTGGAILFVASRFGIKTIAHEQNIIPGRTNKYLDERINTICVSFDQTKKYFKNKNITFTGNPLREESLKICRDEAFQNLGLDREKTTLLVMGGSQGARSLNNLVSSAIVGFPEGLKKSIQLLHIAGPVNQNSIKEHYKENGINGKVFGFIDNISEAYSVCDVAISRAGAAALFELAAHERPMVLIPYPSEKNNQRFNAEFFDREGAAIARSEREIGPEGLRDILLGLLKDAKKRRELSEKAAKLSVIDGAKKLKNVIMS